MKLSGAPWSMNGSWGVSVTTWMYSSVRCCDFLVCSDSICSRKWGVDPGFGGSSCVSISISTTCVYMLIGRNDFEPCLDIILGDMGARKIGMVL